MSKSVSMSIDSEVKQQLKTHFPGVRPISMVIGVSGGADSMCLMHVLHQIEVKLQIVHVNYQKRGQSSDNDALLVEQTADALGIDCNSIIVDPEEAEGQNFQRWARDVRYNIMLIEKDKTGADAIAIAHHRDDQLETILQKIFRGGGMASWSAMQVWDGRVFRPLLNIRREAVEKYCHERSISYRDDESNFESTFARNFLRNEWLPELEHHFPGWRKNVLRVAGQAAIFKSSLKYILQHISDHKDRLNREQFLKLDSELKKSVLIYYAGSVDLDQEISRNALKEIPKLARLQTGKSIQLTGNMELMRDREFFKMIVDTGESSTFITLEKKGLADHDISFNGINFAIEPYENPNLEEKLYLDADAITWPLQVRPWKTGDRFQPLGMEGHQSVADHLTNRKISAVKKQNALVLESFEEMICAVIFPPTETGVPTGTLAELAKCSPSTQRCLRINRLA